MIFADKLISLRKKAGWSQEELAERLSVTRQSVSKWEGAQSFPDIGKIVQLSQLFGVSTDYLLTGRPVCPQDRAALDRLARSCAEAAGRRRGGAFTAREAEVLMSALVEDACVENR